MRRRCTQPGCETGAAGGGRCQDCGRAFCRGHVSATDFAGPRREGAADTAWTRFVCGACAARADRRVGHAAARMAGERADRERRGLWWEPPRP